jgi:hypothetical protein
LSLYPLATFPKRHDLNLNLDGKRSVRACPRSLDLPLFSCGLDDLFSQSASACDSSAA